MNNFDDDSDGGYYGGGCFHGNCTVKMFDGSYKYVKNLMKNDKLTISNGMIANVVCVVKTKTW